MDNRRYYDDFANWYERKRGSGYHKMLDDLEVTAIQRYGTGKDILEVGCGSGLVLARCTEFAKSATGIDLSAGMLKRAVSRGLDVVQGSATQLPYKDESFDLVYSVKVLPHIENIETALREMARVTRPGGYVLAEFYNRHSLRYLIKALKPPTPISESTQDTAVYTRYDRASQIRTYLPPDLQWQGSRGIRVVTPFAQIHAIPGIGATVRALERTLADAPLARGLGGFLMAILRKRKAA